MKTTEIYLLSHLPEMAFQSEKAFFIEFEKEVAFIEFMNNRIDYFIINKENIIEPTAHFNNFINDIKYCFSDATQHSSRSDKYVCFEGIYTVYTNAEEFNIDYEVVGINGCCEKITIFLTENAVELPYEYCELLTNQYLRDESK